MGRTLNPLFTSFSLRLNVTSVGAALQVEAERSRRVEPETGGPRRFEPNTASAGGLQSGDAFLLCSDGVSGSLEEAELIRLLGKGNPAAAAKALTEAAVRAGSRDNLTALCVQVQLRLF